MVDRFNRFIKDSNLFTKSSKLIAAVSGGIDSVCLCHLLYLSGFQFSIAHCNFNLRDNESDQDEAFVKKLATMYNVEFFSKSFKTENYATEKGISIQMAARELRYNWFQELLISLQADKLITAHNKNDNTETILLNLVRGTGVSGLHGILPDTGKIARPLLYAERSEIEEFIKNNGLQWREDSSNQSTKYHRNFIRHEVIPLLKKLNPSLHDAFRITAEKLTQTEKIFNHGIKNFKKNFVRTENGDYKISIESLQKTDQAKIILFETIKEFGFSYEQVGEILSSMTAQSGKIFISPSHFITKDRQELIISSNETQSSAGFIHEGDTLVLMGRLTFEINYFPKENHTICSDPKIASLDKDKLQFPIKIRNWKEGDSFFPLGMKKRKKVSDFFVDQKIPLSDKPKIPILLSGNEIVWIAGHRIDDRYKITAGTSSVIEIRMVYGES